MESGIYLSASDLKSLSSQVRAELFSCIQGSIYSDTTSSAIVTSDSGDLGITNAQARKIIEEPLNKKTRAVLRAIAELGPRFGYRQLLKAVGEKDISGVWAGITRRTRSVLGDREAQLITWDPESIEWKNDEYIDQQAWVTQTTFQALREAFGIQN